MNRESTNKPNLTTCVRGVNRRFGIARTGSSGAALSAAVTAVTVALTAVLGVACSATAPRAAAPARPPTSAPPAPHPVHTAQADASDAAGARPHHGFADAHAHHGFADAETWTKVFDAPERDEWQRPDEVLRAMELDPAMTVADVGAGTGYFAVRLARAVPQGEVIATDLEPDMVRFLGERARREGLTNLRALQGTAGASGLSPRSVDRILLVHVWHHLGDRHAYARDLAAALLPGGRVYIVDFQLSTRRGPPASMRVAPEAIVATLESAGLSACVSPVDLPDQYLVEARHAP